MIDVRHIGHFRQLCYIRENSPSQPFGDYVRFAIFVRFSFSVRFAIFVNFSTLKGAPLVISFKFSPALSKRLPTADCGVESFPFVFLSESKSERLRVRSRVGVRVRVTSRVGIRVIVRLRVRVRVIVRLRVRVRSRVGVRVRLGLGLG